MRINLGKIFTENLNKIDKTICVVGLVFVVEKLGSVLQLTMSLSSASMGPLAGIFLMGLFLPFINGVVGIYYLSFLSTIIYQHIYYVIFFSFERSMNARLSKIYV